MELSALEYAVLGFGLVGCAVAGQAAAQVVKNNGGGEHQQLATACVAGGLSAAVLPAAAVAGVLVTCKAGYDYATSDRAKLHVAVAKAKTLGTMDKVVNGTTLERGLRAAKQQPAKKRRTAAA
jgi:hypothetical protein